MKTKRSRMPSAPGLAALVLRLTVGGILVAHGAAKLQGGMGKFAGFVGSLGIPFPTATAYATVTIEAVGGAMLLIGLATRLWGLLATLLMIGTTVVVKMDAGLIGAPGTGPGMELDLLILAGGLSLVLMGPGPASLDHVIGIDRAAPPAKVGPGAPAHPAPDLPRVTISLEEDVPAAPPQPSDKS